VVLGPEWRPVGKGLNFLQAGLLAGLLGTVAELGENLFHLAAPAKPAGGEQALDMTSDWWLLLLATSFPTLVWYLLFIQGRLLCARAPASSRLRGFALGSVLAAAVALFGWVMLLFSKMLLAIDKASLEGLICAVVGLAGFGLIGLVGEVLFMCYLSRLARVLNSKPLSQAVGRFVSLAIGMIGISVIVGCLLQLFSADAARSPAVGAEQHPDSAAMLALVTALGTFAVEVVVLMGYRALLSVARRVVQESLALGGAGTAT
jgi:hypothetical protein